MRLTVREVLLGTDDNGRIVVSRVHPTGFEPVTFGSVVQLVGWPDVLKSPVSSIKSLPDMQHALQVVQRYAVRVVWYLPVGGKTFGKLERGLSVPIPKNPAPVQRLVRRHRAQKKRRTTFQRCDAQQSDRNLGAYRLRCGIFIGFGSFSS